MTASRLIEAFLDAICAKFSAEAGARCATHDTVTSLTHRSPLEHPWPRAFSYYSEFFTDSADAATVAATVRRSLPNPRVAHVLTVFGDAGATIRAAFEQAGYLFAWSNVLMARSVTVEGEADERVRAVDSAEDVAAINALTPDYPSYEATLTDPRLHDFVALGDGAEIRPIVGKAQLVHVNDQVGYVSDMFVAEQHRGQGLGRALLHALHRYAAASGVTQTLLVPSLMTRENGFYTRAGYHDAVQMHLFVPAEETA